MFKNKYIMISKYAFILVALFSFAFASSSYADQKSLDADRQKILTTILDSLKKNDAGLMLSNLSGLSKKDALVLIKKNLS